MPRKSLDGSPHPKTELTLAYKFESDMKTTKNQGSQALEQVRASGGEYYTGAINLIEQKRKS